MKNILLLLFICLVTINCSSHVDTPDEDIITDSDSTEFVISNTVPYGWYIVCGYTTDLMTRGYWDNQGYPSLIPNGDNKDGCYYAVTDELCYFGNSPIIKNFHYSPKTYYAQAAEYGNNISSETISSEDNSWESYKKLIDTCKSPVYVGWSGDPYGSHATQGIGYKEVGDEKYFILYNTYALTPVYVSYNIYFESVRPHYVCWHPTSEAVNNDTQKTTPQVTTSDISLNSKKVDFSPVLDTEYLAAHDFEFADLNGDGEKDFMIVNFKNQTKRTLMIYYSDGDHYTLDESFDPGLSSGACLNVVKAFDCDNDGDLDVVTAGFWTGLDLFKNNGGKITSPSTLIDTEGLGFIDLDYGDIDNDGDIDLMASVIDGTVRIYINDNGSFTQSTELDLGSQSFKVRFADINKDNYLDIIASKRGGTIAVFNSNNGTFSNTPSFSPSGHGGMSFAVEDVDNDGWKDIVSVNDCQLILYKNGGGSFNDTPIDINSPVCCPKDISLNDLNNDGFPELLIGNFKHHNFILENNNGSFGQNPIWISEDEESTFSVNVFDNSDTTKLIVFGKCRTSSVDFFEVKVK